MPPAPTGATPAARSIPHNPIALLPEEAAAHRVAVGFDTTTLLRITGMAFAYPWRMWTAIIATVVAALSQLYIPQLIGRAVDSAQGLLSTAGADAAFTRAALTDTAVILFATAAVRGLATMLQSYQGEAVGHLVGFELRKAYYAKLQVLAFSYHDHVHTGDLMTRGMLDIEGTRQWISTGVLRMVLLSVLVGGGVWMLVSVDAELALVSLGFVPLVGIGASLARLKLRRLWFALQEELGVLTRVMEENLGGIRVVRAFAAQDFEMQRFDIISARALSILHHRIRVFVANTTTMTFCFFVAMGLTLWVGGEKVINGSISLGDLTAFLAFMTILQMPVRQIAWMVNSIARASTCGGRVFEVLDTVPTIRDQPGAPPLRVSEASLRFDNVSFRYHEGRSTPPVLDGVNFELRRGQVLGIVGPPGSGKSTIANLVPRFYDPAGGQISIDGQDIAAVSLESLRRHVSVVQQDVFLFTSSLNNNLAYGDPWADRSAIRQATESAQLHRYIEQLPAGYRTLVGERGVSLSGGQRQRAAIARGVLPHSDIIVFDDSASAIDAGTEQRIREELSGLTATRAVVIIAHRLSALMHADEILFLDRGRVVERGTHRELLDRGGRYANLYALQSGSLDG